MDIIEFFKVMVESEASDLYLTVARPPMYRIEGKIQPIGDHGARDELRALDELVRRAVMARCDVAHRISNRLPPLPAAELSCGTNARSGHGNGIEQPVRTPQKCA